MAQTHYEPGVDDRDDWDVEDLKVRRIDPPSKKARVHLPVAGPKGPSVDASADVDEAFGGSDERSEAVSREDLEARVVQTLKTIFDPEIPVNVYDLGLIYGLDIGEEGDVEVSMTLTAPACPVAGMIVTDVAERVGRTPGVRRSATTIAMRSPGRRPGWGLPGGP